jgi:hypothetical protein
MCYSYNSVHFFCKDKEPIERETIHCRNWPDCQEIKNYEFRHGGLCSSCLLQAPEILANDAGAFKEYKGFPRACERNMPSEAGAHGLGARAMLRHAKEHGSQKSYYFDREIEMYREHDPSKLNPFLEVFNEQDGRWLRLVESSLRTIIWRSITDLRVAKSYS